MQGDSERWLQVPGAVDFPGDHLFASLPQITPERRQSGETAVVSNEDLVQAFSHSNEDTAEGAATIPILAPNAPVEDEPSSQNQNGWGRDGVAGHMVEPQQHEPAIRSLASDVLVATELSSFGVDKKASRASGSESRKRNGRGRRKAPESLDQDHLAIVTDHFRELCVLPAAPLQRKFNVMLEAIATDVSGTTVFHTNKPLAVLMQWRVFQLAICLMIVWFTGHNVSVANQLSSEVVCNHRAYRFTTLENRAGSTLPGPGIDQLGLLLDGCVLSDLDTELVRDERQRLVVRSYDGQRMAMNGFTFQTSAGPANLDPVTFTLEGSDDDEGWEQCGAARWHLPAVGKMIFLDHGHGTPLARGAEQRFDMRVARSWVAAFVCKPVLLLLFLLASLVLALRGRPGLAVGCVQYGLGTVAGCELTAAVLSLLEGGPLSWLLLCNAAGFLALFLLLFVLERSVFELSAAVGCWWCTCRLVNDLVFLHSTRSLYSFPPVLELTVFVSGVASMLSRQRMLRTAANLMEGDKQAYMAVWKTIQVEEAGALEDLRDAVMAAKGDLLQDGEPRQYQRRKGRPKRQSIFSFGGGAGGGGSGGAGVELPGILDPSAPVTCLDQLYAQATAVRPVFVRKAQHWADRSNGLFRTKMPRAVDDEFSSTGSTESGFVRWRDAVGQAEAWKVQWPPLKAPRRAMDKTIQSYAGEVSRLLDVCRQSIVFDTIEDLHTCLDTIFADPTVKVHTLKNRYDSIFEAATSTAGFRDLVLNLRHDDDCLRRVGAETHICELQLILRSYAALQSAETHQRYLQFRQATSYSRSASLWRRLVPWFLRRKASDVQHNATALARSISGRALGGFQAPTYNLWGHMRGHTTARDKGGRRMAISPAARSPKPPRRPRPRRAEAASLPAQVGRGGEEEEAAGARVEAPPGPRVPSGPKDAEATRQSAGKGRRTLPETEEVASAIANGDDGVQAACASDSPAEQGPVDEQAGAVAGSTGGDAGAEEARKRIEAVMEEHFVAACTRPAGQRDEDARRWHTAMAEANRWSAFHTSAPLVTATTLRGTVVLFNVLSLLFVVDLVFRVLDVTLHARCDHAAYRLVDLELSTVVGRAVTGFALTLDGCLVDAGSFGTVSGNQILLDTAGAMNGFAVVAREEYGDASFDASRFRVEGSDDWDTWAECSSTAWGWRAHDVSRVRGDADGGGALDLEAFDLRPPWPWRLMAGEPGLRAVLFLLIAVLGRTKKPERTQAVWLSMHVVLGVVQGAAAIGCQLSSPSLTCLLWFLASVASLLVGAAVFMNNRLLPISMVYFVIMMTTHALVAGVSWLERLVQLIPDALLLLLGGVVTVLRQMVTHKSIKKIESDRKLYDAVWGQMQNREDQLATLREVVGSIHLVHQARQFARKEQAQSNHENALSFPATASSMSRGGGGGFRSGRGLPGAMSPLRLMRRPLRSRRVESSNESSFRDTAVNVDAPVTSLDQLFAQAAGLEPVLRCKVKNWALSSNGQFPCMGAGGLQFVRWEEMVRDSELLAAAKWPNLKTERRAIQKALRSYSGDVSRLLDLCRHQIVFEEVDDLTRCLRAIIADDDVTIVRVKNRLAVNYDARMSAGYRDVALNLRVLTPQTFTLGVETHVCELQLILRAFAETKSNAGHKRYVEFRNALAE